MANRNEQEGVDRFSVSLSAKLLNELDEMVREKGYDNRSLAIADMIRDALIDHRQHFGSEEMAGTITLVYDHHRSKVQAILTNLQHEHLNSSRRCMSISTARTVSK
jgi:CopG family nickel-responsive transcriptional regulator